MWTNQWRRLLPLWAVITAGLAIMMDSNGNPLPIYSPLRAPALPLAVRGPYSSVWSPVAGSASLNSGSPMFWTGAPLGWTGIVTVDGTSYDYLGSAVKALPKMPNYKVATPVSVSYDMSYSNFTFLAGPVTISVSFFSPVLPQDLCRTSVPLSYMTTTVQSNDGCAHSIQTYTDINTAWVAGGADGTVGWALYGNGAPVNGSETVTTGSDTMYSWIYEPTAPLRFSETADLPQWGSVAYSTQSMGACNFTFDSGAAMDLRYKYVKCRALADKTTAAYSGSSGQETVFAYAHDFGQVSSAEVRYTIGTIQDQVVRYLYRGGVASLDPWWKTCYGGLHSMIRGHWEDFTVAGRLAGQVESQLQADIHAFYHLNSTDSLDGNSTPSATSAYSNSGTRTATTPKSENAAVPKPQDSGDGQRFLDPHGSRDEAVPDASEPESYYAIVALSARQVMGSLVYAVPPKPLECDNASSGTGEPLLFLKEISSDGNVNTLDVLFPASPFFLYANPEMIKYALQPIFEFQQASFYPNGWAMHDLGSNFPNATGHVQGDDEAMPVEESGNLILMSYAYYKFTGNADWLRDRFAALNQSAGYLVEYAQVPATQLSTDDFAGRLANQSNLALKGVVALQAMGAVSRVAGAPPDGFPALARRSYRAWEGLAIEPGGRHTVLAYGWRGSWGLLYNAYYDRLLSLGVVGAGVYAMQSAWYADVAQDGGVPLDSRHAYAKSDWQVWAAAACGAGTRARVVAALAAWLGRTPAPLPFSDLYETLGPGGPPLTPDPLTFRARPVVGGHFAFLALLRTGQTAAVETGDTRGSVFVVNGTNALNAAVRGV